MKRHIHPLVWICAETWRSSSALSARSFGAGENTARSQRGQCQFQRKKRERTSKKADFFARFCFAYATAANLRLTRARGENLLHSGSAISIATLVFYAHHGAALTLAPRSRRRDKADMRTGQFHHALAAHVLRTRIPSSFLRHCARQAKRSKPRSVNSAVHTGRNYRHA